MSERTMKDHAVMVRCGFFAMLRCGEDDFIASCAAVWGANMLEHHQFHRWILKH